MSTGISRENTTIIASSSSSSRVRACVCVRMCAYVRCVCVRVPLWYGTFENPHYFAFFKCTYVFFTKDETMHTSVCLFFYLT